MVARAQAPIFVVDVECAQAFVFRSVAARGGLLRPIACRVVSDVVRRDRYVRSAFVIVVVVGRVELAREALAIFVHAPALYPEQFVDGFGPEIGVHRGQGVGVARHQAIADRGTHLVARFAATVWGIKVVDEFDEPSRFRFWEEVGQLVFARAQAPGVP